jgi:transcriptional regulator with GAF, ATPase, and Fis domain
VPAPKLGAEVTCDPRSPLSGGSGAASRFRAIYAIGRELLEQKEPQQVIRAIHRAIVENLRPDHACVLALLANGAHRPLAAHDLDLSGPQESWPLSHTVLRRAKQTGLAVLAADALGDAALATGSVQRLEIRSVMCVPLGEKAVRGMVYLDNRRDLRPFTSEDLEFVTAISAYASILLERAEELARTTEALRLSDERLEVLQGELLRHRIVGRSPALLEAYDTVRRFARTGARVVLRGETGTGKELFARAYAAESTRRGAYVPVPIPAIAPTLAESELFGHVRGAFTEASRDKKGRLELAHGGVLFLDEVGDIEPGLQPKLLRFLDSGELYRVGDTEARFVDALVVSATNRLLEKDVESGRFRADLLARLGHIVTIPPLRERPDDIPVLVEHFLELHDKAGEKKRFCEEALDVLKRHSWTFNVRELQQVVERACCLVDREVVATGDLPDYIRREAAARGSPALAPPERVAEAPRRLRDVVEEVEKAHILRALEFTKGNKRRAIELLDVSPDTFYKRLEEFGIRKREQSP